MHSCSRVPWGREGTLALPGQWGHPVLVTCHTPAHSLPEPTWTGSTTTPSDMPGLGPHCSKLVPQASWSKTRSIPWTKERHQAGAKSLPPQEPPTTGTPLGLTSTPVGSWAGWPLSPWASLPCLYAELCLALLTQPGQGQGLPGLPWALTWCQKALSSGQEPASNVWYLQVWIWMHCFLVGTLGKPCTCSEPQSPHL